MEVLAILFWSVVLIADFAFMTQIPRIVRDAETWCAKKKAQGRAGTRTEGCRKMTDVVYHVVEENARCPK
jgi:hypothetical protein